MLRDVGRGAAVFAAERETLQQAQRHQQNRCRPADADFAEPATELAEDGILPAEGNASSVMWFGALVVGRAGMLALSVNAR